MNQFQSLDLPKGTIRKIADLANGVDLSEGTKLVMSAGLKAFVMLAGGHGSYL